MPNASNLNYLTGDTVPNSVITGLGAAGAICIYTSAATHLIVDIAGYFADTTAFTPSPPRRVCSTAARPATPSTANSNASVRKRRSRS